MTATAAPASEWLKTIGARLCLRITPIGSEARPRLMAPCDGTATGPLLIQVLKAKALASQVDLRTESRATKLLLSNQKVDGIEVQTPKGRYQIKAKAVVLATGGFAAYSSLVNQVHPSLKGIAPAGFRGATGIDPRGLIPGRSGTVFQSRGKEQIRRKRNGAGRYSRLSSPLLCSQSRASFMISLLFFSCIRKCEFPLIPISGKCTSTASPP